MTSPAPLVHLRNVRLSTPEGVAEPSSLWLDPASGKVAGIQDLFVAMSRGVVELDLDGDVVAPGFIETQINGAYGIDLGVLPDEAAFPTAQAQEDEYLRRLETVASRIVETGVTSIVPTVMTQPAAVYPRLLPILRPRTFASGASVLGYHAEGPFLSPSKAGCHPPADLRTCSDGQATVEATYGSEALAQEGIKLFTVAPEVDGVLDAIAALRDHGAVVSIGHSIASDVQAMAAVLGGARMVTHLFNAQGPLDHRNTGIVGLLSAPDALPSPLADRLRQLRGPSADDPELAEDILQSLLGAAQTCSPMPPPAPVDDEPPAAPPIADDWERFDRPYYGLIADGIHVHPTAVRMAYRSHPKGCILTTDCLFIMDPHAKDGRYPFRPGTDLVRKGKRVTLGDSATLVGSAVDLQTCVLNLAAFAGIPLHEALASVTTHPARMLGGEVERRKGRLERGFDADLVVLDKQGRVRATWVRGVEVWRRPE